MSSWEECRAVERDPAKVSGAWVFTNTRVPVRALFENLEDGATVDQFVEWFPGVTREQVEAVLEFAAASLELQASVTSPTATSSRQPSLTATKS
jgi:uncharacterized protein (DUF433 family)